MIEENLIKNAIDGEAEAFGRLYDIYQPRIYRFIYLRVSHREEAEDITHRVFISAWENIAEFEIKDESSFSGWLYSIARNKVIDHYRTRKITIDIENIKEPAAIRDTGEEIANFNLEIEKVKKAIGQLKDIEQDVIIMRFVEDLTPKEVAKILNKNEGAIRLIQHRAIKNLRKMLNA